MDLFKGKKRKNGAPDRIRTSDLPLRRRLLYPAELPGRENGLITVILLGAEANSQKESMSGNNLKSCDSAFWLLGSARQIATIKMILLR